MPLRKSDIDKMESKSDDKLELQIYSATVIQRNFRSFLWRKFFRNLSLELRYSLCITIYIIAHQIFRFCRSQKDENLELIQQLPLETPCDIITIGSPRTKSDFNALESKVHKWKESKVSSV